MILYRDGLQGWGKKGYGYSVIEKIPSFDLLRLSTSSLSDLLKKDKSILILDVRDNDLYDSMRLKDANVLHIRVIDLVDKKDLIPKDKKIVVMCHVGKQSVKAGNILKQWGFDIVGIVDGGFMTLQRGGLPVEHLKK